MTSLQVIDCAHWSNGVCSLGLFGGKPSPGVCALCVKREARPVAAEKAPITALNRSRNQKWHTETAPQMWAELHRRPLESPDLATETIWLENFTKRLPCGECKEHWKQLTKAFPPDLSSGASYARWTFDRHNEINRSLGKSLMSYEDAAKLYRWETLTPVASPARG